MKIVIGCDHGGFDLKERLVAFLEALDHEVRDVGCYSADSVDYPVQAREVAKSIASGDCDRGILLCGTGIGMSIAANRQTGIRAALCHEPFSARMSREHNDANVLCLGARVVGPAVAEEMVRIWLSTPFAGGRHDRRIRMIESDDVKS